MKFIIKLLKGISINQPNTPITKPIEIYFSKMEVWSRYISGFVLIIVGSMLGFMTLFVIGTKSAPNNPPNLLAFCFSALPIVLAGYFAFIRWGRKRLDIIKLPRLILYADKFEYFNIDGILVSINWYEIKSIKRLWYSEGMITITLEKKDLDSHFEKIKLNMWCLTETSEWIYEKMNNQLK